MEILILPVFLLSLYLVYDFTTKPDHAVSAILLITLINCWFIYEPFINIGLHTYLYDPLFVLIFFSALFRIFFREQITYTSFLWLIFGIIIFFNIFIGIKENGTSAGVTSRGDFYYWTGALYFMSFEYSRDLLEKILKNWFKLCLILLAIVYFRFIAEFLHLPIAQTWIQSDDNMGLKFRVTHSTYAYLLSVTIVMLFVRYLVPETTKPNKIITILFIFAVLALQHRSVWAATIMGIASASLLPSIKTSRLFGNVLIVGMVGGVLLLPFIFSGVTDVFLGSINEAADRATHLEKGTFAGRMKGWEYFLSNWEKLPFGYKLTGEPFGSSITGIKMALHNFYLQMIKDTGLLGLVSVVLFYFLTLAKLYLNSKHYPNDKLYFALFFMLLIGQLTFYIPYSNQAQHGIILGIAASLARRGISNNHSTEDTNRNNSRFYLNKPRNVNFT